MSAAKIDCTSASLYLRSVADLVSIGETVCGSEDTHDYGFRPASRPGTVWVT